MTHRLSLHHVTAMEASPPELVSIAAELGLRHVCLFTCVTPEAASLFPVEWTPSLRAETAARCADLGVSVHNLEWFDVTPEDNVDFHRRGLEIGAKLGARTATTHVVDTDPARAAENFARFCELTAEYGITPCIEFTVMIGTSTIGATVELIDRAGHKNAGIALDSLHLFRSGGSVAEVRALDPRYIRSVQISDGPRQRDASEYFEEACFARMIPGEGAFPLRELLAAVSPDMIVDIEVPLRQHQQNGLNALERCRLAVAGARSLVKEPVA